MLASELIAIRQLIPFVGSGTEIIAIIISAVLLPLAIGYHHGGRPCQRIRARLLRNMVIALCMLGVGLSYPMLVVLFGALNAVGITQPIFQTAMYSILFLVTPVYLLAQTVPLISNYFAKRRVNELTGRMLFFSTVGSFFGSVFSTLVLMNWLGVHSTVIITLGLLGLLVLLLSRRMVSDTTILAVIALMVVTLSNSPMVLRAFHIVSNNAYNTVALNEDRASGTRYLSINRSNSSALNVNGDAFFPYIQYINSHFITPISTPGSTPRRILVLGAGGFTIGLDDTVNDYVFVDIDPALKAVSEQHFLQKPLTPNKQFVVGSARAFVSREMAPYDLIIVDTFTNAISAPMETTSREFLLASKKLLKPGGALIVNQIMTPDFSDRFSTHYDRTFASVFAPYTRQVIGEFNPWAASPPLAMNVLYIYYDRPYNRDTTIYSDDLNRYSLDRHRD